MKRLQWIYFIISIMLSLSLLCSCASKIVGNSNKKGAEFLYVHSNESQIATKNKFNQSAEDFINYGIIEENKFTADNYVSRIVAVKIISDIIGLNIDAQKSTFTHPFVDLSDRAEKQKELNRDITRYEAALIIKKLMRGNLEIKNYCSLVKDDLKSDYKQSAYFAVQNSYLLLDDNNRFNGDLPITRGEMLRIFSCAVDSSLRDKNYSLQIPAIYSNNAILQAGKPMRISGRAMSGDVVTVKFKGETKTSKVVDGKWQITMDSQDYGGPYTLTIKDSGYTHSFSGIYVGEVFVVAGQSNAEWSVYESADNKSTLRKFSNQTRVRLFRPREILATTPLFDVDTNWEVASDEYSEHILGSASAIGVFFVRKLMEINPALKFL